MTDKYNITTVTVEFSPYDVISCDLKSGKLVLNQQRFHCGSIYLVAEKPDHTKKHRAVLLGERAGIKLSRAL